MDYIISIKDLSSRLLDAFNEGDGDEVAVAIVDRSLDVAPILDVRYDKGRKCILIRIGYCDIDIDNGVMKAKIIEVNKNE